MRRVGQSCSIITATSRDRCFCLPVLERRYPKEVQDLYDAMRRFARVVGPIEHDKFIESHACEYDIMHAQ